MISSEVQRTLVKSPPELWAELSDPVALARHLGELGEFEITRVEPEKLVEWEAAGATGTVAIKPSGWGTKVTLTVTRELEREPGADGDANPEDDQRASEPQEDEPSAVEQVEPIAQSEIEREREIDNDETEPAALPVTASERFAPDFPPSLRGDRHQADETKPASGTEVKLEAEIDTATTIEEQPAAQLPDESEQPRRGFFARLFARARKHPPTAPEPEPPVDVPAPAAVESPPPVATPKPESPIATAVAPIEPAVTDTAPVDTAAPENPAPGGEETEPSGAAEDASDVSPAEQPKAETSSDLAAELLAAEEEATEQMTAVLTGVLDRLGAAHHRPFSRS